MKPKKTLPLLLFNAALFCSVVIFFSFRQQADAGTQFQTKVNFLQNPEASLDANQLVMKRLLEPLREILSTEKIASKRQLMTRASPTHVIQVNRYICSHSIFGESESEAGLFLGELRIKDNATEELKTFALRVKPESESIEVALDKLFISESEWLEKFKAEHEGIM